MSQIIPTFQEYFSKSTDYEHRPEVLVELLSTHIQEGKPGFLFKNQENSQQVFVRTEQLLNPPTADHNLYRFIGFIAHSSVAVIEKKI